MNQIFLNPLRIQHRGGIFLRLGSVSMALQKRKRVVLTIEEKLKINDLVANGRTLASDAEGYNVGKSTVHDIIRTRTS